MYIVRLHTTMGFLHIDENIPKMTMETIRIFSPRLDKVIFNDKFKTLKKNISLSNTCLENKLGSLINLTMLVELGNKWGVIWEDPPY